jgi:hypothetical protein
MVWRKLQLPSYRTRSATLPRSEPLPTTTGHYTICYKKISVLRSRRWAKVSPKRVELILEINKLLLLQLVGFLYYFTYNDDAWSNTNQVNLPAYPPSLSVIRSWTKDHRWQCLYSKHGLTRFLRNMGNHFTWLRSAINQKPKIKLSSPYKPQQIRESHVNADRPLAI